MTSAVYAAILAVIFFFLSIRVIGQRRQSQAALGTGNNADLERVVRVHANFSEYVPFALLLIFFVEQASFPAWSIHLLGALLVVGRLIHAYGVSRTPENLRFRVTGMAVTFTILLSCAGLLFYSAAVG
jgi:uncharacterized protein